jgi:parvulin-like peptidyl-prolyl isomerase
VIARVDGRPITQLDFDRLAQPYFQNVRAQLGGNLSGEILRIATFNVFDELLRREILLIESQRQKLEPAQADIDAILAQDPSFQTNGRFDPAKLTAFKTNPTSNYAMVLPRLRELAGVKRLDESLRRRFTPAPAQLRAEWEKRNDQVRAKSLALLTRDMPLEAEASEAEVAAYYQAHPDQFMRRTRIHLRYTRLPLPAPGDSTRAAEEAATLARGRGLADSLRARLLPDSGGRFVDSGPFDVPPASVPGLGRVPGLTDTLGRAEDDSTIRVVGPYTWRDAVLVGVVANREGKRVAPLRDVYVDARRRADSDKRRAAADAEKRAFWEAHRERWRTTRVTLTRLTLDASRLAVDTRPQDVERWYAQNARTLPGLADSANAPVPALNDSLRGVVRARLADEQRARRAAGTMARIASAMPRARELGALARSGGAKAETLALVRGTSRDSLFGAPFADSLLDAAPAQRGAVQGPRAFGDWWVVWRIDAVDTAYVPPYEVARSRSDAEFAEAKRQQEEAEALAHFEAHRAGYRTPERFGLDYVAVHVPPPDSVRIPEAEVRHEYDANPAKYRQEEQAKARHILFMARDASPEVDRAARARADSLLAAIRKDGGDFGDLARRFSQEPGAATGGGELGWFGRGRMVKEFEAAAFALKPGEISGVVKTQFGYHIIQLEERKAAGLKPFEEVRPEIRAAMAQARGDSTARRGAEALRRKLALGGNVATLAAPFGGMVAAAPVATTEALPGLGFVQGLAQDLPGLATARWAPAVYRAGASYIVLRLREKVAPQPAGYDEVRSQVAEDVKNVMRRARLEQKVAAIRAALAAGATLDSVAVAYGGLRDVGPLARTAAFIPGLGAEPRVVERAFATAPGATTDSLQVASGVVWLRIEERKTGDEAAYRSAAPQLEAELVKQQYEEWLEAKKKTVRIEILRPDLRGPRPNAPTNG